MGVSVGGNGRHGRGTTCRCAAMNAVKPDEVARVSLVTTHASLDWQRVQNPDVSIGTGLQSIHAHMVRRLTGVLELRRFRHGSYIRNFQLKRTLPDMSFVRMFFGLPSSHLWESDDGTEQGEGGEQVCAPSRILWVQKTVSCRFWISTVSPCLRVFGTVLSTRIRRCGRNPASASTKGRFRCGLRVENVKNSERLVKTRSVLYTT